MLTALSRGLLESAGIAQVLPQDMNRRYAIDGVVPAVVALPGAVDEVSRTVALAHRQGAGVIPFGGGTKMTLGNAPQNVDLVLGLAGLDALVDYQPSDLTATFQAGTTLANAQGVLEEKGQFLPLQSPLPGQATIGGVLSTAFAGPSAFLYGLPRDWLIGITVVGPDGTVTQGGGKVVKNVTGFDMNRLYTGSLGTLGIIVEATFKLSPRPPLSQTLLVTSPNLDTVLAAATAVQASGAGHAALALVNPLVREKIGLEGPGYALLALFQGRLAAVSERSDSARRALSTVELDSAVDLLQQDAESVWQPLIDLSWVGTPPPDLSIRFSLLPAQVPQATQFLDALDLTNGQHGVVADLGIGTVRSLWWSGDGSSIDRQLVDTITAPVSHLAGGWVVERCPPELKREIDVWGPLPSGLEVMRRIKSNFDPKGILNPGRFVAEI